MFRRLYNWIRFGKVTAKNIDHVEGTVSEVEYLDSKNQRVGYWAYGHFDPNLPYRGPEL